MLTEDAAIVGRGDVVDQSPIIGTEPFVDDLDGVTGAGGTDALVYNVVGPEREIDCHQFIYMPLLLPFADSSGKQDGRRRVCVWGGEGDDGR